MDRTATTSHKLAPAQRIVTGSGATLLFDRGHASGFSPATAVGGGANVDRAMQTPGGDWWWQKDLADNLADSVIAGGPTDVLLCHNRPQATPIALGDPPCGWWPHARAWADLDEALSDAHSARLQRVVDAVQPQAEWHGHLQARTNVLLDHTSWAGPCRVQGLADDGSPAANTAVIGTDGMELRS